MGTHDRLPWSFGVIAIVVGLTVAMALAVTALEPEQYEADVSLTFRDYSAHGGPSAPAGIATLAESYAQSARAVPTLVRVIARHELQERPGSLRDALSATAANGMLTITARAADPERAAALANQVAAELLMLRSGSILPEIERYVVAQLQAIDGKVDDTMARLEAAQRAGEEAADISRRLRNLEALRVQLESAVALDTVMPIRIMSAASPPARPAERPLAEVALVAALAGALLGFAAARLVPAPRGAPPHDVAA